MLKSPSILAVLCSLALAPSAVAQRARVEAKAIPVNLRPPAGMCRIWLDGVPPARQPAPTDCATALRNRPARAQVIFGDDYTRADSEERPAEARSDAAPLKGLAPLPKGVDVRGVDSAKAAHKSDSARKKADPRKPRTQGKPDTSSTGVLPQFR
jgi:hypothetical protein